MKIRRPEMFNLAEQGKKYSLIKEIVCFILIFFISSIVTSIIIESIVICKMNVSGIPIEEIELEKMFNSRLGLYAQLFTTLIGSLVVIIYCKYIKKRSLKSMGFQKKNAFRDYAIGMIVGFVMFSAVVGINLITGAMKIEGLASTFSASTLGFVFIFLLGFICQGAEEEILTRGYLMVDIGARHKMTTAVIISSVVFALLHMPNTGITFFSLINLVLIAVFFALYIICFDNIWGACAIHSVWNFVQGNFYGIRVSGMQMSDSVFSTISIQGKELINGGAFGAEGGIATTIVIVIALILLFVYMKKTGRIENKNINNLEEDKVLEVTNN